MSDDEPKDSRTKRMAVRFTDEDLAFLAENAEDEGVEVATLVRMIVARLRKGRAPLISMMEAQPQPQRIVVRGLQVPYEPKSFVSEPPMPAGAADDVLASRMAELDSADVIPLHQPAEEEAAAIPLVRVPRQQYNPGRN